MERLKIINLFFFFVRIFRVGGGRHILRKFPFVRRVFPAFPFQVFLLRTFLRGLFYLVLFAQLFLFGTGVFGDRIEILPRNFSLTEERLSVRLRRRRAQPGILFAADFFEEPDEENF